MIRLTTMMIGSVMLLAGCAQGELELTGRVDAAGADTDSSVNTPAAKSQIVRALLQAIDEIKGESPEVKEELRRSLLAADDELAGVLGDTGKQLILNANKKPAATIIGGRADPSARRDAAEKPSAGKRGSPLIQVKRLSPEPADDESDEPKTRIIKALLTALHESEEDDADDAGNELRTTLIEADKQLRQVLGGQSKRLIEAANRKPLVPIIGPRPKAARDEKTSATKAKAPAASFKPAATDPSDPTGQPKTKIVKALIEAIEQIEDEDADTKQGLRQSLMQADLELSRILGDNSKRLIQQANEKPLVPMIREAACPPEKERTEKK